MSNEALVFDTERALSKALSIRVETFSFQPNEYKFRIGGRWNLIVNQEQLELLWDSHDNHTALRDVFDGLKSDCLIFQTFTR